MIFEQDFRPHAFLIVDGSKVYTCENEIVRIGRSGKNDLVLSQPQVSREYAEILYEGGRYVLRDLDSTGGTFVNGDRVYSCALNKGDVITLTNVHLVFGQDTPLLKDIMGEYDPPSKNGKTDIQTDILGED